MNIYWGRIHLGYIVLTAILLASLAASCNPIARHFGGDITINLPQGQKLVTASWKDANVWYLTRSIKPGEQPETLRYQESSTFGVLQGSVTFIEHQ